MPERLPARMRRLVTERAGFHCEYCLTPAWISPSPYSAEHILPKSKGGGQAAENLALSCQGCNGHKASRTTATDPATRNVVPLFHPRRQNWSDHFGWKKPDRARDSSRFAAEQAGPAKPPPPYGGWGSSSVRLESRVTSAS